MERRRIQNALRNNIVREISKHSFFIGSWVAVESRKWAPFILLKLVVLKVSALHTFEISGPNKGRLVSREHLLSKVAYFRIVIFSVGQV